MTTINWPSNTTEIIDKIRNTVGRDITIYSTVSGIPCTESGCELNPVTNLSTDQYCPTCSGEYWINDVSGLTLTAHVVMRNIDTPVWEVGGRIVEGDALVQLKLTETTVSAVNNSEYYIVDSRRFIKNNIVLRGVPEPNRILVTLEEKEGS